MIDRRLAAEVRRRLTGTPAVAILGPRQVGKTTLAFALAEERASTYLDLESDIDRAKLADPEAYLATQVDRLVVLDEIHRVPALFSPLRGVIDRNRRAGRRSGQFVILGSASLDLMRQSGESLAGRIAYTELGTVDALEWGAHLAEREASVGAGSAARRTLWVRGGFPESLLAAQERDSFDWRRDFIASYLRRDVPELGPRLPAETLGRFWTMLAHLSGGQLNASALSRSLGIDARTVNRWLDLLVDLLLVRRLAPWHGNVGKRLVKAPKIYVRDSGVLHALLSIDSHETLAGHPKLGDSFEGFVIENLLAVAPSGATPLYYRTAAGAEIDLVLEFGSERWAVEIKSSSSPKPSRGFHEGCRDVGATRRIVVHGGDDAFPLGDGLEAMPLEGAMRALSERA